MEPISVRRAVQGFLRARHIELRKAPSTDWAPLPIFALAVERVMQLRGNSLRFVQVSANDGLRGDPLRQYVLTRGWRGILCEPQEDVFAALQRNYASEADRLIFEKVAISPSSDRLVLYRPPDIGVATGADMPHGLTVTSIDVEGYDFEVLKTLSLDRHRPAVIQFEHGHLSPSELTDASLFLGRHGYLLYYGGRSTDSVAMPEELFAAA